jgi:hypothetical protein
LAPEDKESIMSMKDLLNKMTELQGTTKEEKLTTTGKRVLNESAERPYVCVHAKKGKCEVKANSSYEAAKKAADKWKLKSTAGIDAHVADKPISTASLEENTKPSLKSMFNALLAEAEQVTIQPAKQNTQVIKQGDKTLGTVTNPNLANQIKQSIGKGEMSLAGDELQEDDMSEGLDPAQKQKLKSLIYAYRDATDPEGYSDEDPDEIIDQIRQEFGDKIADTISQGPSMHYPRPDHVSGVYDPLANKSSPRVTKLGKINRQDAETMKRNIKQQQGMTESKLTEKAKSKSQQQAAGAALAAKRGDAPKSTLKGASKEMAKMPAKELEKFAKTKHKGLPDKKQKTDESSSGVRIVHNKLLGGWFIVRGPHQTPISGKFSSKEEAEKSLKQKEKPTANEAAMPTHDGDFGAGLGAGRNKTTLEDRSSRRLIDSDEKGNRAYKIYVDRDWQEYVVKFYENGKYLPDADYHADEEQEAMDTGYYFLNNLKEGKKAKPDFLDIDKDGNKKESMKKAAADKQKVSTMKKTNEAKAKPDFLDLDKDGDKKEPMKKAAADAKKKKTVKEGTNPTESARLLGKAHAMANDTFSCKYEEGSQEAQAYLDGYKSGLDECYGSGGGMGMQQDIGMMPGMDSMVSQDSMMDTPSPRGGSEFAFGGFDDVSDDDMMAFESWDRQLNELLNEGKMKDIDIDMKQMSDAEFKKEHGKSKADMKKDLSGSTDKKPVKEGISVSVSKGQQGSPDSVTVSAQDQDADALLAMIKQAGLGLFGGEETSGYGSPVSAATQPIGDVGDHDSMMALIKKMSSTGNDYEDEESMSCDSCDDESDSKALVVGEEQGYDDKEDESLGMRTGKESDKEQSMKDRRDDSYGKFGKRTDEDESEDQMEFEVAESNAPDSDEAETTADENAEAKEDQALAGAMSGDEEEIDEGSCSMDEEEELTEWANDAGYTGSENIKDNTFEQDIEFMTRVISGGLNGQKQDQTILPHTRVKVAESSLLDDWKKLSGIK